MAQCYHDEQDFKSDLNIEVARENDMLENGEDLPAFKKCTKNPGHSGFIPFQDLTLGHLPQEIKCAKTLDNIKKWGNCVVKLVVDRQRNGKLVKDAGSGYVFNDGGKYYIQTNNHVVKTDNEVKQCTVEFFYDSHDRSNVITSKGVKLVSTCPFRDVSIFVFDPVPDFLDQLDVTDPSPSIVIMYKNNSTKTFPSNPRLRRPQLYHFTSENLNNPEIEMIFLSSVDYSISYLISSYFKFQPIPSNIQELTRIEIRIAEDDGKSRVIPGDVVNFNDEYVIKIAESIFQDKVKKCRLVWNGEVISRGTRLYFRQVDSREFFDGDLEIDLEVSMHQTSPSMWIFDCEPLSRRGMQINEMVNGMTMGGIMCCISHPHGGIKMVTFGRWFGKVIHRFDNEYRRIDNPGKDCKCKMVSCVRYSCKTCRGSSGSPVFIPNKVSPMICGMSHFMGERVKSSSSNGELIGNINIAWH